MTDSSLNAARRRADLIALGDRPEVDVLVIGGGVTGAGVALDAATRGLRTVLVESRDLAFGTSRWSSKLAHGGLRYLASGRVGVARESAIERGVLMTRTAPHLIRALPQVVPLLPRIGRRQEMLVHLGFRAGDALRSVARTPSSVLPRPRRIAPGETTGLVPAVRRRGLRGGLLAYDGQLVDDARLVVAIARTAAEHGASILTRVRASEVTGKSAVLTDALSGETLTVRARAVINATGVWAGTVDPSVRLRPSRGTHLVVPAETLGNPRGALTVPVPGSVSRYVFALPQQLGRVIVGLTDVEAPGPVPDVPEPTDDEVSFLLDVVNSALDSALSVDDVVGKFAGLRPLIESNDDDSTADLSRKHAVLRSPSGVITVVGGKLTTYRRMAEDAVDAAVTQLPEGSADRCRTTRLPLVGAPGHPASQPALAELPASLVRRHGGAAVSVVDSATVSDPLEPIADGVDVTRAEVEYAVRHEGALDADDVLHRRTRIGLVDADAERALPAVRKIIEAIG